MRHRKTIAGLDIDLFDHISVGRVYNTVKDFKMHSCGLDFDSLFIGLLSK